MVRDKYYDVMKYYLRRLIILREIGMVIFLSMFWFEGSFDGFVIDLCFLFGKIGIIELKCLEGKKNYIL